MEFHAKNALKPDQLGHHDAEKDSSPLESSDNQTTGHGCIGPDRSEHEQNVKRLKHTLLSLGESPSEQSLSMVDVIQRLCLEHKFGKEIQEVLRKLHLTFCSYDHYGRELHEVALSFRLLRQQGYYVCPNVFNIFKDQNGKFQGDICKDIKGLTELYEASQLAIEGEDILDEARDFSAKHLKAFLPYLDRDQGRIVRNTLNHPHHTSFPSFRVKNFVAADWVMEYPWTQPLLKVAETEFNVFRSTRHEEMSQLSKWWRELGLAEELKFARDQPLKWHTWSAAVLHGPNLSEERIDLTKIISFIYIIDDIFDVYGKLHELIIFTEIMERWDEEGIERLPSFMKSCLRALDDITNEISLKICKKHGQNPVRALRAAWATLCKAFLVEARWFASGILPTSQEYLKNGIVSTGMHVALAHVFFLIGGVSEKSEQLLVNCRSEIVSSAAAILRLLDDVGAAKDENPNGYDGSFLECYVNENKVSNPDDARREVQKKISKAWKILNKGCLFPGPFTASFTRACLDAARTVSFMHPPMW